MDVLSGLVRFFQQGGMFMYPILIVFGLGLAIAVERWAYLTMSGATNRALWKKIVPFLKAGNFQEAATVTGKSKAAIGSILTYGLYRVKSARRRDDVEKAMEESLMEVLPRLEKRTHYLATLANIATLLGLLGTIIGLINAFTAVANANHHLEFPDFLERGADGDSGGRSQHLGGIWPLPSARRPRGPVGDSGARWRPHQRGGSR